jgi:hypothetical protein
VSAIPNLPDYSPEQAKAFQIFHPYAFGKTLRASATNQRFVHYTSADTALKIFQNREVWMRKSSCMNDFMELEHGFACLSAATDGHKDDFRRVFDNMFPEFTDRLVKVFNSWLPVFRNDTYIACFSEHDDVEDKIGRLSMWRAYGGNAGVAVVLNGRAFVSPTDALKAYTSPEAYLSTEDFDREFKRFIDNVASHADFVKAMGEQTVFDHVFEVFRSAMLCTKHPGFREEREWRVIYSPTYERSDHITIDVQSIGGTPQPISKIPLSDIPDEGLVGIEIPALVERVIIGPTQYPWVIREAFVAVLSAAGMPDPPSRVIVSDIPLRT